MNRKHLMELQDNESDITIYVYYRKLNHFIDILSNLVIIILVAIMIMMLISLIMVDEPYTKEETKINDMDEKKKN